ncbi:heavy-metal-associated domain-containing protein [Wenyingzhuangia sp. IMCC45467]
MKILIKYMCIAFLAIITLWSCKPSSTSNTSQTQTNLPVKLETISLNIEGMTCEIGCAKIIESKVSKLEGVAESKVDFEVNKGTFTYDINKTSKAVIVTTINSLLDGKTYKATNVKTCCTTKEIKTCTQDCAEKCGHKVGEVCEKCTSHHQEGCCTLDKNKECSKECVEKFEHKPGDTCVKSSAKKDTCKPNCEKPCCSLTESK